MKGGQEGRDYLVQLLVEVFKLGRCGHDILIHEEGGLEGCVGPCGQELHAIGYEGLVEQHADTLQEVASVSGHFYSFN